MSAAHGGGGLVLAQRATEVAQEAEPEAQRGERRECRRLVVRFRTTLALFIGTYSSRQSELAQRLPRR